MTAPSIAGTGATTAINVAANPWTVNLPASIQSGEILLAFLRTTAGETVTLPTDWSWGIQNDTSDNSNDATSLIYKVATGSEGSTLSVDISAAGKGSAIVHRISGGTTTDISISSVGVGTDQTTEFNGNSWSGTHDVIVFACSAMDGETQTVSSYPTNYTEGQLQSNSGTASQASTNCRISTCARRLTNASNETPGTQTWSAVPANGWSTVSVAIFEALAQNLTTSISVSSTLTISPKKVSTHGVALTLATAITALAQRAFFNTVAVTLASTLALKNAARKILAVAGGGASSGTGNFIQADNAVGTAGNPAVVALPSASTVGSLVVIAGITNDTNGFDTPSGWTRDTTDRASSLDAAIFSRAGDGTTLSTSVSSNGGANGSNRQVVIAEYDKSYSALTSEADQNSNAASTTTLTTGSVTPGTTDALVLTVVGLANSCGTPTLAADSGFATDLLSNDDSTNSRAALASKKVTDQASTSSTWTWTSARNAETQILAYTAAAGGGSSYGIGVTKKPNIFANIASTLAVTFDYVKEGAQHLTHQADVTLTTTLTVLKAAGKRLDLALTDSLTLSKFAGKTVPLTSTFAVNLRKFVTKAAFSVGTTLGLTVKRAFGRSVAVGTSLGVTFRNAAGKRVALTQTPSIGITKLGTFFKSIAITPTLTVAKQAAVSIAQSISQGFTFVVDKVKVPFGGTPFTHQVDLTLATSIGTSFQRGYYKLVSVGTTLGLSVKRAVLKYISFAADDPWGILAARAAITQPGGSVALVGGTDDIQTAINGHSAGTTYWLQGTFNITAPIEPKDGDTFVSNNAHIIGNASYTSGDRFTDGSVSTGTLNIFDAKTPDARGVTFKGLEISGARQSGIDPWLDSTVKYCLVHDNLRNGIGSGLENTAGYSPQSLVEDCIVWDNGSVSELGAGAGGIKWARTGDGEDMDGGTEVRAATSGSGVICRRVYVFRNIGNGLWHDVGSGGNLFEDCIADSNTRKGFHNEIAVGPDVWQDNTARYNCNSLYEDPPRQSDWGMNVMTSLGCTFQRNHVYDNVGDNGIKIDQDNRAGVVGHNTDDITVINNNLQGGDIYYVSPNVTGTVTDSNNTDLGDLYGASYKGSFNPDALNGLGLTIGIRKFTSKLIAAISQGFSFVVDTFKVPFGGTPFTKDIAVTLSSSITVATRRGLNQLVAVASTLTVGVTSRIGRVKTIAITLSETLGVKRAVGKRVAITETPTLSLRRSVRKLITQGVTTTIAQKNVIAHKIPVALAATADIRKAISHKISQAITLVVQILTTLGVPAIHARATARVELNQQATARVEITRLTTYITRSNRAEGTIDG